MDPTTWAFFFFISVIVSLDVLGLTLVKAWEFERNGLSRKLWAILNAGWHAGLLFLYVIFFSIFDAETLEYIRNWFLELSIDFPDFAWIFNLLKLPLDLLIEHIRIIFGIAALIIVWFTYSSKIISIPEEGDKAELPFYVRWLARILSFCSGIILHFTDGYTKNQIDRWNINAALVAVDMLALAALLKSGNYVTDIYQYGWLILTVGVVVFVITLIGCKLSSDIFGKLDINKNSTFYDESNKSVNYYELKNVVVLVFVRLAEPFLIFYFATELIGYLISGIKTSLSLNFIGALILTVGLIIQNDLSVIIARTLGDKKYKKKQHNPVSGKKS